MTKHFYTSVIFFLGLAVTAGLLQSGVYLQAGVQMPTLPSYATLFLIASLISLVVAGFLLRYYRRQSYRVAYVTGLVVTLTTLVRTILAYVLLVPLFLNLSNYYPPLLFLDLGAGIVYASSLIFSPVGRNTWIKGAGVSMLLLGVVSVGLLIWSLGMHPVNDRATLTRVSQWIALFGNVPALLFIGHFWQEQRAKSFPPESTEPTGRETLIDVVRLLGLGVLLFWGSNLLGEGLRAGTASPNAKKIAPLFEARTYVDPRGDSLQYRLLKPRNYDSTRHYPLVVSLHGGGGWGTDNLRQLDGWEVQKLAEAENQKKFPAFVLVPQCPRGASWGGLPETVRKDSLVFDIIGTLEREFPIDSTRRYVAGGSLGGYGTWFFIGTRPGMFAAALPQCGGGDPALAHHMVDVAIWAFHGADDRNVPVAGSRDVIAAIRKAGGHPRYSEFAGVGHNVWPEVEKTPGVLDWLFAQKRK